MPLTHKHIHELSKSVSLSLCLLPQSILSLFLSESPSLSLSVSISLSYSLIFSLSVCPSLSLSHTHRFRVSPCFFLFSLSLYLIEHYCQRLPLSFPLSHTSTLPVPLIPFLSLFFSLTHSCLSVFLALCLFSLTLGVSLSHSVSLNLFLFRVSRFSYSCSTYTEQILSHSFNLLYTKLLIIHKIIHYGSSQTETANELATLRTEVTSN